MMGLLKLYCISDSIN